MDGLTERPAPVGLVALAGTVGAMAFVCGLGLIVNGLGMPLDQLDGTPFSSYVIPGLVLSVVVGGSLLGAAWLAWRRVPVAPVAMIAAGGILLGWIIIEALLIVGGRVLQAIILLTALAITAWAALWWRTTRHAAATQGLGNKPPDGDGLPMASGRN